MRDLESLVRSWRLRLDEFQARELAPSTQDARKTESPTMIKIDLVCVALLTWISVEFFSA